jgi:hypothetical protein
MGLQGVETQNLQAFICSSKDFFALKLIYLKGYKGKPIQIQLEDYHLFFLHPYKLNILERGGLKALMW